MTVTERKPCVGLVIHFPDEIKHHLQKQPDPSAFVVKATKAALEKQRLAQELAESAAQADRGEYADPKDLEAFFDKWKTDES